MKNFLLMILVVVAIFVVICNSNFTFAYDYSKENTILFYDENKEKLEENIELYLSEIDDFLILNSSYEYSDVLKYNYDFLLYFAFDYIFKYEEFYKDKIKVLDKYSYYNNKGNIKDTNKYISLDEIYLITDKYFGIRDFKVVFDNVNVIDNYVSIIDYNEDVFKYQIIDLEVYDKGNVVDVEVMYKNDNKFLYTFDVINNVMKINNIEVL